MRSIVFSAVLAFILFIALVSAASLGSQVLVNEDVPAVIANKCLGRFLDFNEALDDYSLAWGFGPYSWTNGSARTIVPLRLLQFNGTIQALLREHAVPTVFQRDVRHGWDTATASMQTYEDISGAGIVAIASGYTQYIVVMGIYGQDQTFSNVRVSKIGNNEYRVYAKAETRVIAQSCPPMSQPTCYPGTLSEARTSMWRGFKYHDYKMINNVPYITKIINGARSVTRGEPAPLSITHDPLAELDVAKPWLPVVPSMPL